MLESIDNNRTEILAELEKEYYAVEMPKIRMAISELIKEIGDEFKENRIEFLENEIKELKTKLTAENIRYGFTDGLGKKIVRENIYNLEKEIKRKTMHIMAIKNESQKITQEMIARAREYPISDIVGCKGKGNILCIAHKEKHPSMTIKNNYAYCFSCHWHGDAIACYMLIHNVSFVEAVKALQ